MTGAMRDGWVMELRLGPLLADVQVGRDGLVRELEEAE